MVTSTFTRLSTAKFIHIMLIDEETFVANLLFLNTFVDVEMWSD